MSFLAKVKSSGDAAPAVRQQPQQLQQQQELGKGMNSEGSIGSTNSACSSEAVRAARHSRAVKYRSISSSDVGGREAAACVYGSDEDVLLIRPKLRGKIHLGLFLLAPVWVVLLLSACRRLISLLAASISCFAFLTNFAASALLHSASLGPQWRSLVVKIDHAGIFVVISSCTTPIPLLLFDFWPSVLLLSVQGLATLYGFWTILFGDLSSGARLRRAYTYIGIGLLHATFLKAYVSVLTVKEVTLVVALAAFYIVGALVYGSRWPDPFPAFFGFHELFHLCCCISFCLTLWLNYEVITRAEAATAVAVGETAAPAAATP